MIPPHGGFWPYRDAENGPWLWQYVGFGEDYMSASGTVLPDGFVTDFASVPALLQWLPGLNPYAPDIAVPSALHDLELMLGIDQRVAAANFYVAMKDWGVPRWKRIAYFLGVLLASSHW